MRTLLLAGVLAVAGFVAPASAQVAIDTPIGGVRVGPQPLNIPDIGPTDTIGAMTVDAAPSRSSATTARSAGSAVADKRNLDPALARALGRASPCAFDGCVLHSRSQSAVR